MTALAIVLGCAMYTAFNATQAIFLTRAGAHAYPLFFVVLALTVWPAIAVNQAIGRRHGVARALRYNLLANALIPIPIFVAYAIGETPVVAFAAYVVYSVAFEVLMLAFWAFVTQYFNILEAKRIFPVIAAGSGLGYIFAGATTSIGAQTPLHTEGLAFLWSAGAAASGLIAYRAERRLFRPPVDDDADDLVVEHQAARHRLGVLAGITDSLDALRGSRLVLALVLLGTVLIVAMRISDYVAAVIFVHATRNVTELSVLIGNAWEISYVIQLALGLWITPWLLAKAGVKNAILTLPILTLLGFAFVALAPALLASLFLFVVRNGIQTGIDDPAENVLGGALPNQVGPKLKVLLDTLVLPGAAAIAGIGLLVVQSIFRSTSVVFLAVVGAVVTLAFVGAALWVRSLYVSAIYQRLRSHTLSLSDLELALGRPSPAEVSSLVANIDDESEEVREFAAAALARLSPPAFLKQLPRLAAAADPRLRRVAYQMAPPGGLDRTLIERGAADADPWVIAAAAVAGGRLRPRWERWEEVLAALRAAEDPESQAASAWAAALVGDRAAVAHAMMAASAKVRLEALRSFAKLKGDVPTAARPLIRCLGDPSVDVRREALRQAARWTPPPGYAEDFAAILVENLKAADPLTRRLAGQAIAAQAPNALRDAVPLLEGELRSAVAAVEALVRSAREDHVEHALSRVEETLGEALDSAGLAARLEGLAKVAGPKSEDARFALLRTALEDYVRRAVELALAALRALHEKRGFVRVERGLRSDDSTARVEAVETLLNFGPARLAGPLAELLDAENFEVAAPRPLDETELEKLAQHPDAWVRRAVAALSGGDDGMKDLIALKKVPLFADLTLEQLASIDRLMVTRHYLPGETIFRWGDVSSELYVVLEGEVRIHRDNHDGEVTLARLGPSSVMGEMAPFTDQPRSAGAVAVVETTCRVLRKDRLETILHEHPEVLLEVIRNLSQRLTVANEQLEAAARAGQAGVGTRRAPRRRKEPAAAH